MRYFTKELWSKINSLDETIRVSAEEEWKKNDFAYAKEFEETKKHLPQRFLKSFLARYGLHDYDILKTVFIRDNKNRYLCELHLTDGIETVSVVMTGLKTIKIDVNSFHNCVQGKLSWGYSEFSRTKDNTIQLSVLCDIQNELQFEFKSIKLLLLRNE